MSMDMILRIFAAYTIGPVVVGQVLYWVVHQLIGVVAQIVAGPDDEKMEDIKMRYIFRVTVLKEYTWAWAIGMILFLIIGIVQ
jgi:hypothetical protein